MVYKYEFLKSLDQTNMYMKTNNNYKSKKNIISVRVKTSFLLQGLRNFKYLHIYICTTRSIQNHKLTWKPH